jgi:isoleucyl-tRNA synthetase
LYHLHLYFKQNSDYDNFDSSKSTIKWAKDQKLLAPSDVWLLSKLQKLVTNITQSNEKCKFHEAARALDDFIINSLSQIYIPITRGELWEEDESKKNRRFAIYAVLSSVLRTLDVLMHPFSPFTSEYLYLCAFKKMQSVLLESWPTPDQKLINDKIEESFDLLKETISVSAAARMKGKLKRRWPLNEVIICVKKNQKQQLESLSDLLVAQLNVENYKIVELEHFEGLELLKDLKSAKLPVTAKIEFDRKKIGPKAKKEMTGLLQKFEKISPDEIAEALLKENHFTFDVNETKIKLERDDFVVDFDVVVVVQKG